MHVVKVSCSFQSDVHFATCAGKSLASVQIVELESCIFGEHKPLITAAKDAFSSTGDIDSCSDQEDFTTGAAYDILDAAETKEAAAVHTRDSCAEVGTDKKHTKPVLASFADPLHSSGPTQPHKTAKPTQPGKPNAVPQNLATAAGAAVDIVLPGLLAEQATIAFDMQPLKDASPHVLEAASGSPAVQVTLDVPRSSADVTGSAATQLALPAMLPVAQKPASEEANHIPAAPSIAAVSVAEACTDKLEVLSALQAAAEISTASAQLSSPVAGTAAVPAEPDSPATDAAAAQDQSAVQVTLTTTETADLADAASQLHVQVELADLQASTAQLAEAVSDPAAMQSVRAHRDMPLAEPTEVSAEPTDANPQMAGRDVRLADSTQAAANAPPHKVSAFDDTAVDTFAGSAISAASLVRQASPHLGTCHMTAVGIADAAIDAAGQTGRASMNLATNGAADGADERLTPASVVTANLVSADQPDQLAVGSVSTGRHLNLVGSLVTDLLPQHAVTNAAASHEGFTAALGLSVSSTTKGICHENDSDAGLEAEHSGCSIRSGAITPHAASLGIGTSAAQAPGHPIGAASEMTWLEVGPVEDTQQDDAEWSDDNDSDDMDYSCHLLKESVMPHMRTTTGKARSVGVVPSWQVMVGLSVAVSLIAYAGARCTNLGACFFVTDHGFPT